MSILNSHVLILNKSFRPIRITTVEKVMTALAKGALTVLDPDNYITYNWKGWLELPVFDEQQYITTGRDRVTGEYRKVRLPSIAVLCRYNKIPNFDVKMNIKNIWLRDNMRCVYSGKKLSLKEATKDHVIPLSRGGSNTWENIVTCCPEINRKKADKTPEEAGLTLTKIPRKPKWSPLYSALSSLSKINPEWQTWLTETVNQHKELQDVIA